VKHFCVGADRVGEGAAGARRRATAPGICCWGRTETAWEAGEHEGGSRTRGRRPSPYGLSGGLIEGGLGGRHWRAAEPGWPRR
jgi:hypothetical protein